MNEIKLGSVVYSKTGRDSGRYYAVVGLEQNFALIADGALRKIEKPKRKKLMHLNVTKNTLEAVSEKLQNKKAVHNKELIAALKPFNRDENTVGNLVGGMYVKNRRY